MNGLSRKASLLASYLGWHVSTGARGSWSGWSVRLGGGGTCFWAVVTMEMAVTAGYVGNGRATTWSQNSRPWITNMPGTWDHLAPSVWAGQRNEIWVSSTAVRKLGTSILESAAQPGSDQQSLGPVGCLFLRLSAQVGSGGSKRGLWFHGSWWTASQLLAGRKMGGVYSEDKVGDPVWEAGFLALLLYRMHWGQNSGSQRP